jgi:hypothetical protein
MIVAKVTLRYADGREEMQSLNFECPPNFDAEYEFRGTTFYIVGMKYTMDFPGGVEVVFQEAGSIPKEMQLK